MDKFVWQLREAPKKVLFFSGPATDGGGGGGRGLGTKKNNFFEALKKSKENVANKLEEGGGVRP